MVQLRNAIRRKPKSVAKKVSAKVQKPFKSLTKKKNGPFQTLRKGGPLKALQKEAGMSRVLHSEVITALEKIIKKNPEIKKTLEEAYGYAVIPSIGRASAVLGGAYGIGEVFEHDRVVGYAAIIAVTIGVQLGGATFHELVIFPDKDSFKAFKAGKYAFAADAGVAMVKAAAQATKGFGAGSSIATFSEGGMLLDLGIGIQRFSFRPAAIGRTRTTKKVFEEAETSNGEGGGEEEAAEEEE